MPSDGGSIPPTSTICTAPRGTKSRTLPSIGVRLFCCLFYGCGAPIGATRPIPPPLHAAPVYAAPYAQPQPVARARVAYVLLGLFLGGLGIHNFYGGYHGRAVAQLVITLLLGWLFIGLLITGLWALIEIITVDTDAAGVRMV